MRPRRYARGGRRIEVLRACPACGRSRIGAFRFCTGCHYDFDGAADAGEGPRRVLLAFSRSAGSRASDRRGLIVGAGTLELSAGVLRAIVIAISGIATLLVVVLSR
jgi:hypothetical protein